MIQFPHNIMILQPEAMPLFLIVSILVIMQLLYAVDQGVVLLGVVGLEELLLLLRPGVDALLLLPQQL